TAVKGRSSNPISAIAVASGSSDVIWVGHNDGLIFKTANGTADQPTWSPVTPATLPSRYATRIALAADPNTVYLMYGGFTANNLWRSTDGGSTWTALTG